MQRRGCGSISSTAGPLMDQLHIGWLDEQLAEGEDRNRTQGSARRSAIC